MANSSLTEKEETLADLILPKAKSEDDRNIAIAMIVASREYGVVDKLIDEAKKNPDTTIKEYFNICLKYFPKIEFVDDDELDEED